MGRKSDRLLMVGVVVLACIGIALVVSGFSSVGSASVATTATPKKVLSTILKVSPIGTQPATAAPVKVAPIVIETATAAPKQNLSAVLKVSPIATEAAPVNVAPVSGQGGYVCADGAECVKGNINKDGVKLYHLPVGCPSYKTTTIDMSAGERMFANEADAIAAGWTKAGNCN